MAGDALIFNRVVNTGISEKQEWFSAWTGRCIYALAYRLHAAVVGGTDTNSNDINKMFYLSGDYIVGMVVNVTGIPQMI